MNIEMPVLKGATSEERIAELQLYLYRLAQDLNFEFDTILSKFNKVESQINEIQKKQG